MASQALGTKDEGVGSLKAVLAGEGSGDNALHAASFSCLVLSPWPGQCHRARTKICLGSLPCQPNSPDHREGLWLWSLEIRISDEQ